MNYNYLFINTAFLKLELAYFNANELLFYHQWSSKQEMVDLIANISSLNLANIQGVIISNGPGRFMSLRVGVACAQTLAYIKNIPLYSFSSYDYFSNIKLPSLANGNINFLQQITTYELFLNNQITKFTDLVNDETMWLGDVRHKHLLPEQWQEIPIPPIDLDFLLRLKAKLSPSKSVNIIYGKEAIA